MKQVSSVSDIDLVTKFFSQVLLSERIVNVSGCKEEHESKVSQFNKTKTDVNKKELSRLKEGEESIQGKSFRFECPNEQAVSRCGMKQRKTDDGKDDIIFKMECQKVVTAKQVKRYL